MSLLQKLAELATELDSKGYYYEASQIDEVIKEAAEKDMADDHHPPTPPPVAPPSIKTGPVPPAGSTLPPKQERPVPAPQQAWDDDKKDLGKEWKAIEKRLKKLPEDKWEDMLELLKDNMEKIEKELDKDEQEADDSSVERQLSAATTWLAHNHLGQGSREYKLLSHLVSKLGYKVDEVFEDSKFYKELDAAEEPLALIEEWVDQALSQEADDSKNVHKKEKSTSHLPRVNDPKTASMYVNDGAFAAVNKIKEELDKLSPKEKEEALKLLKALMHKMEGQKADTRQPASNPNQPRNPAPAKNPEPPKSLDIPPIITNPNQPTPPLSPSKHKSQP
jgi:hypothetical protein